MSAITALLPIFPIERIRVPRSDPERWSADDRAPFPPVASVLESFGVDKDPRGNARAGTEETKGGPRPYATSVAKVFAADAVLLLSDRCRSGRCPWRARTPAAACPSGC